MEEANMKIKEKEATDTSGFRSSNKAGLPTSSTNQPTVPRGQLVIVEEVRGRKEELTAKVRVVGTSQGGSHT